MNDHVIIRQANVADAAYIQALIEELALYEKAADEVEIAVSELKENGWGKDPAFESIVAVLKDEVIGTAIFYPRYSTWKGRYMYLEDLVVSEKHRGEGIGSLLFNEVVRISEERKAAKMEWQVLEWNTPAIDFYKKMKACFDSEWINVQLTLKK